MVIIKDQALENKKKKFFEIKIILKSKGKDTGV